MTINVVSLLHLLSCIFSLWRCGCFCIYHACTPSHYSSPIPPFFLPILFATSVLDFAPRCALSFSVAAALGFLRTARRSSITWEREKANVLVITCFAFFPSPLFSSSFSVQSRTSTHCLYVPFFCFHFVVSIFSPSFRTTPCCVCVRLFLLLLSFPLVINSICSLFGT